MSGWILTATGRKFDPLHPRLEDICIEDIAHSLAMQCRFTGHTRYFYSVAQHSILVSRECDPQDALHGLLHDASEAYLCDIPSPLKCLPEFEAYRNAETWLQACIFARFFLSATMPESVKRADRVLLATEARDLMPSHPEWQIDCEPRAELIQRMPPAFARSAFLRRFDELVALRGAA